MAKRHLTDRRPTIMQIAETAGVSVSTVSKVLNGRADVSSSTRERIEQVIEELGFVRNRAAQALRKGRTGLVDLTVPSLNDDYFMPIFQGVEEVLKAEGIRLVLTSTNYEAEQETHWFSQVTEGSTDGAILLIPTDAFIQHLRTSSLPFVIIHNQGGLSIDTPSVRVTSWEGGYAATNYLISLGHRRIAYIAKNVETIDAMERFAGYMTALEQAGIVVDPRLQCNSEFKLEDGYRVTKYLFSLDTPPTAIFAGNDHVAVGVYQALYEMNLSIPDDVSVIGFDDLSYSSLMFPALTTVQVPRLELGRVATTMLLRLMDHEPLASSTMVLSTQLVIRRSCAPYLER